MDKLMMILPKISLEPPVLRSQLETLLCIIGAATQATLYRIPIITILHVQATPLYILHQVYVIPHAENRVCTVYMYKMHARHVMHIRQFYMCKKATPLYILHQVYVIPQAENRVCTVYIYFAGVLYILKDCSTYFQKVQQRQYSC